MTSFSRVQLQPAYVIHQRPYRDTSAIVEIFSEAYGRRALVAKGLKRPKSKFRGLLQPFQPLLISWVGKSELGTLTDVELYTHFTSMKAKYLPSAFYLNELLLKLLHKDDPHGDIFVSYHNTLEDLQKLSGTSEDDLVWQCYLRRFEITFMQSIGYGLVLDHDVVTQKAIQPELNYEFVLDHGPIVVSPLDQIADSGQHLAQSTAQHSLQRGIPISGQALLMLADESLMLSFARKNDEESKKLFKEAKRLLRTLIDFQLGDKSLHSRELFTHSVTNHYAEVE